MSKLVVQTWSGDGVIAIDGVEYPVTYKIQQTGSSNVQKTTGLLHGLPPKALDPHPQGDRLPLRLETGHNIGVALFGGVPCAMTVNTAMPGYD
jgi:hypothetical protein